MSRNLKTVSFVLIAFGGYFSFSRLYFGGLRTAIDTWIHQLGISHILTYLVFGTPIFGTALYLHGTSKWLNSLGLDKSFMQGLSFALVCTTPMFLGSVIFFEWNANFSINTFLITILAAAFFEELYFRSFLFGQVYRYSNWGFVPAVLIEALIFGLVHLYQGSAPLELLGIFMITFSGGVLFAWTYVEWNYNLWVSICLHLLMNLSWGFFTVSDNALGGIVPNICRGITIALIIILTIRLKKKRGEAMAINSKKLWMK